MTNELYKFLKSIDNSNKYSELLNYIYDSRLYHYGKNFKNNRESFTYNYIHKLKFKLFNLTLLFINLLFNKKLINSNLIINSAYFNLKIHFKKSEYIFISPPWSCNFKDCLYYDYDFLSKTLNLTTIITFSDFKFLNSKKFEILIDDYLFHLEKQLLKIKIKSIFLPHDLGFFEKCIILAASKIKIKTFNFIHGMPAVYNKLDQNRCDFLVVFGNAIKMNFINVGFDKNKILVAGHPVLTPFKKNELKFTLDNILILGKSLNGSHWSHNDVIPDRSNLIYYLFMIQTVLEYFGVKNVRFRPHPSEDINWYLKYIDNGFFIPDLQSIDKSINESTLIIGPTSTVFLESINSGVNYLVYEPKLANGLGLDGYEIISPFDGSDINVPVANDILSLKSIILKKQFVNPKILSEYLNTKFNPEIILDKIR